MNVKIYQTLLIVCLAAPPVFAADNIETQTILVVTHKTNPVDSLSKKQVLEIFMGQRKTYPDGRLADPINIGKDSPLKAEFYKRLTGLSLARVNAYWAKLRFAGRTRPPKIEQNQVEAQRHLAHHNEAITYVEANQLHSEAKVLLELK